MTAAADPAVRQWVATARSTPIGELAASRGWRLIGGAREACGPCPDCGGADRFNVNHHKNVWFCRQCSPKGSGRGDVISLVMLVDRCDFIRACETLTGQPSPAGGGVGLSPVEMAELERKRAELRAAQEAAAEDYREQERKRLWRWWRASRPPAGTPVEDYLTLRRCTLPPGALLRFSPEARLYVTRKEGQRFVHEVVHAGPAMVAAILGPLNDFRGVHATWLDLSAPDGKARVPNAETGEFEPAKKVRGSQQRGRIELVRHAAPRRLYIGEGIETVLSVRDDLRDAGRDLTDAAFWSAINLGNLGGPAIETVKHSHLRTAGNRPQRFPGPVPTPGEHIPIPDSVEEIVILGDGDSEPEMTTAAITRAGARWARPGRTIRPAMAPAGLDFNTLRRARS